MPLFSSQTLSWLNAPGQEVTHLILTAAQTETKLQQRFGAGGHSLSCCLGKKDACIDSALKSN